jgi:hypothetical protein
VSVAQGVSAWIRAAASGVAGAVAGAAIGDPIAGGVVAAMTTATFDAGVSGATAFRRQLEDQAAIEAVSSLAPRAEDIERNILALRLATDSRAGNAADAWAILQMFIEAWTRAADHRARTLIENAVVNAFDPKRYEEGLTRTLFAILGRIEYGDIETLRAIVVQPEGSSARSPTLRGFHLSRLIDERLAFSAYPDTSGARATELGKRLLALIDAKPNAGPPAPPEAAAKVDVMEPSDA